MKTERVKIWAVIEGPYDVDFLLSDDNYPFDIPEDCRYLVVCKVEKKKKLLDKEFWFERKEDAYRFKLHVDSKMEATIIYAPSLEKTNDVEYEDE